jgi:hypothetical protein
MTNTIQGETDTDADIICYLDLKSELQKVTKERNELLAKVQNLEKEIFLLKTKDEQWNTYSFFTEKPRNGIYNSNSINPKNYDSDT